MLTWRFNFDIIYILKKIQWKGLTRVRNKGELMDLQTQWNIIYIIFFLFTIHMTWILAKRQGISDTLDYLEEKGLLELDKD
tara:strand:+ start:599 stop:841 length:243 start_codon:yes stop_codon:yes gene_type:complete